MDFCRQILTVWSVIISVAFVVKGDPRIDKLEDFYNNDNLIEYSYRYAVDESKSQGPVMDRWEHRIGEYVKGAYSVVDPDGRVRTVDYEVDGKKGYHAVIRMNEPGPELLSIQQLSKSFELFPESNLPTTAEMPQQPSLNLSPPNQDNGKAWNYHSNTPYYNKKSTKPENKKAVGNQGSRIASIPLDLQNLPISPANYNAPQTTNLIYFKTPSASIYQEIFPPIKSENFISRTIKREALVAKEFEGENQDSSARSHRNSKLVRRYKSFSDITSN